MSSSYISKWRQGSCFSLADNSELRDILSKDHCFDDAVYIVLTHSCSVSIDDFEREPLVEYIIARPISKKDNALVGRKNPRRLHLDILKNDMIESHELHIHERGFFSRRLLGNFLPNETWNLDSKNISILIRWIVKRYDAPAFPDEFNKRIKSGANIFEKEFKKDEAAKFITGVYITIEPEDEELDETTNYEVEFRLTVDINADQHMRDKCDSLAQQIKQKLQDKLVGIVLLGDRVSAIGEDEVTVADLRQMKLWMYDYLSDRDTPGGEFPLAD